MGVSVSEERGTPVGLLGWPWSIKEFSDGSSENSSNSPLVGTHRSVTTGKVIDYRTAYSADPPRTFLIDYIDCTFRIDYIDCTFLIDYIDSLSALTTLTALSSLTT